MLQFSQEYIRNFIKPFIAKVLTDMSTCEEKREPMYLYKILNNIQPDERDRRNFENKYFRGTQPANRPFRKEEEAPFRKMFLDQLEDHVKMRRRLSQQAGMRAALLPDKEAGRTFGSHQALTLNLVHLSYQMAQNFEKEIIKDKLKDEGAYNLRNKGKLASGEMKLVIAQDGSGTRIMTEEEAAEMARTNPDAALMPFLEPGLLENLERTAFEKGLENPPEPTTISAKPVALLEDFENAKLASIRQLILAAGLEITVELTIDANGMITGTVSDAEGQKLSLTVDTKKPNYAADKFTFKFLNEGPSKHLANRKIKLSTDDMRRAFYGDEGRKKAAQVYAEQGERGEMAGEKPPLPMPAIGGRRGGPVEGIPMPFVPPSGEKAGTIGFPSTTGKGAGIPGQLKGPSQFPVTPMEIQVSTKQTPGETKKYKVTPTITIEKERLPTPTVPHTISWKKQRVAAGRVGGGLPDLQYKTRTRTAMRAPTPRRRKPKMPWPAKFGIGAGAVTGGLTFWGAWKVSAAAAVTAMHPAAGTTIIATVKIVLGCLGIHYPI